MKKYKKIGSIMGLSALGIGGVALPTLLNTSCSNKPPHIPAITSITITNKKAVVDKYT
ncbi:hypothetical protein FACS1894166_03980 [Bacilli bacterium]|nr:hypothetical protein FACS1894166_03980 [Bacilli bacterium]